MRLIDADVLMPNAEYKGRYDVVTAYDIANAPTVEPEPRKKGKWIFIHPLQADDEGAYICSNCHRGDWDIKPTDKYCKFCEMEMDIYER